MYRDKLTLLLYIGAKTRPIFGQIITNLRTTSETEGY